MRWSRIVILCVGMGLLGACGNSGGTTAGGGDGDEHGLPGDPVAGAAVYARICIACHDARGTGNGGVTGANFVADRTRLAKTNTELLTSIRDGKTTGSMVMPAQRGALSEQEMKDALSYIRKTFGGTH